MTARRALLPLLALAPALVGFDPLQMANGDVERGNEQLKAGKPEAALQLYDKALGARPNDPAIQFDRGNALFALRRFDEAADAFTRATEAKTTQLRASAFYNRGNAFFRGSKYGEAIESYKRALALDPNDVRAKWNLELALRKKKDEDDKQKQQQNQQPKQDQPKQGEQKQDQPKQGEQKQDQPKQGEPKQDQPDKQQQPEPQQGKQDQPASQPPADKNKRAEPRDLRDLETLLDGLERSPRALEQERARVRAQRRRPPERDW
jgi:Ca-activated chloride channel family protein